MSDTGTTNTDVLIVGAGPTGLTMACELSRRGISCRIIDKNSGPVETSRAIGVQARTMEVFADIDLVEAVLADGTGVAGMNGYVGGQKLFRLDAGLVDTPYPSPWLLPQSRTEQLLVNRLHELDGTVERDRELAAFAQDHDTVTAVIKDTTNGTVQEVTADWLVGCDGAHSLIRDTLGLEFTGETLREDFLLADADLSWEREREAHLWFHEDGFFVAFPTADARQWRVIVQLPSETSNPDPSVDLLQQLMRERTGDREATISNPSWVSQFSIDRRRVADYRKDRVFLAGDAAHIHSPLGGLGMNIGIQDAYNLGWKLALVIKGIASDRLLDTYTQERLPVAESADRNTGAATNVVVTDNLALQYLRDQVLTRVLRLGRVQSLILQIESQLNIEYRDSPLSQDSVTSRLTTLWPSVSQIKNAMRTRRAPKAGDRAPEGSCWYPTGEKTTLLQEIEGTEFVLLLFRGIQSNSEDHDNLIIIADEIEQLVGGSVRTNLVLPEGASPPPECASGILLDERNDLYEQYGAAVSSLYLIRPDGYIGFRSQPARTAPLVNYLTNIFTLSDATTRSDNSSSVASSHHQQYPEEGSL